jgi:hypothetical protein
MKFSIIDNQLHVIMTPEEHKKLNAGLTAKKLAKVKVGPFTAVFEVVEDVATVPKPSEVRQ